MMHSVLAFNLKLINKYSFNWTIITIFITYFLLILFLFSKRLWNNLFNFFILLETGARTKHFAKPTEAFTLKKNLSTFDTALTCDEVLGFEDICTSVWAKALVCYYFTFTLGLQLKTVPTGFFRTNIVIISCFNAWFLLPKHILIVRKLHIFLRALPSPLIKCL